MRSGSGSGAVLDAPTAPAAPAAPACPARLVTVLAVGATPTGLASLRAALGEEAVVAGVRSADGLDGAVATFAAAGPAIVLVPDEAVALRALDAGATGVLLDDVAPALLRAAVRAAAGGAAPVDPRLVDAVAGWMAGGTGPELSARERQVLDLVCEGLLNKQIARRLGITTATVKSHLTRVYERLGVEGRAGAAAWVAAHEPAGD